jgi:hypothetical protein
MKASGLAGLAIGLEIACFAGCGHSHELPAPKGASLKPYVTEVGEIQVEYRPVSIPSRMAPNSQTEVRFEARNMGVKIWPAGGGRPLRFGYHWEVPRGKGTRETVLWDDSSRGLLQSDTKPGETAMVTLPVHALPKNCPTCRLVIAPLLELKGWSSALYVAPVNIS